MYFSKEDIKQENIKVIFEICIYKYSKYISLISCNNFCNLIVIL